MCVGKEMQRDSCRKEVSARLRLPRLSRRLPKKVLQSLPLCQWHWPVFCVPLLSLLPWSSYAFVLGKSLVVALRFSYVAEITTEYHDEQNETVRNVGFLAARAGRLMI